MMHFIRSIVCVLLFADAASAQNLATKARAILQERCYSCHGEGGANEGGFNFSLNRKRLVRELVVPGDPDASALFERVTRVGAGSMPDGGPPLSRDEIATLKSWIAADAPAFSTDIKRSFISPVEMLAAMENDLTKANEDDRPFYRYFTLTHLYNASFEDNELESHRQGLSKLINSLSWGRIVRVPKAIDTHKTILRIDLRHYKWNETDAWSRVIAADPYHVTYTDKSAKACYTMTGCELPHVRADWFVFAASRPPLYNLVLGLPETPEQMLDFEQRKLEVNVALNLKDRNDVLRAGFTGSGVSLAGNYRLIERHVSSHGAYWKSYDFKPHDPRAQPPRRRSLKTSPTGPGGPNGFEHDGGEMIFNLPNGLQGYMLTDATGKQIPDGPTDVVVDKEAVKRGRDPKVVNGVSCMNCHWSGMLNKSDQIRDHVLSQPANFRPEVLKFVTAVYAEKPLFAEKLAEDRKRFEDAVKLCGLSGLSKTEPVATLAFQFEEPLDIDLAAAEAGVSIEQFTAALNSKTLGPELGSLPQGELVARDRFVPLFGELIRQLKVGEYHEPDASASAPASGGRQPSRTLTANAAGDTRDITLPSGEKLTLVWCPPGKFTMGTPGATDDEAPVEVTLTKGFWIARTETTQAEWTAVMKTSPWIEHGKTGANFPAVDMDHTEAEAFCGKLNSTLPQGSGFMFALPTEAQWEYACRAGTKTAYNFGDDESKLGDYAWFEGNAFNASQLYAHVVATKKPNPWGLFDMHGNTLEWCRDWYAEKYDPSRRTDPTGPGSGSSRVLRGGSWGSNALGARSSNRNDLTPDVRGNLIGFRVVAE